jgi:ribosomal protein L3
MCKGLMGKKLGMIGHFSPEGQYIPVTVVEVGPCFVTQIKSDAKDGYSALQLGFEEKKSSRVKKPLTGHFSKVVTGYLPISKSSQRIIPKITVWGKRSPLTFLMSANGWMWSVQPKDGGFQV